MQSNTTTVSEWDLTDYDDLGSVMSGSFLNPSLFAPDGDLWFTEETDPNTSGSTPSTHTFINLHLTTDTPPSPPSLISPDHNTTDSPPSPPTLINPHPSISAVAPVYLSTDAFSAPRKRHRIRHHKSDTGIRELIATIRSATPNDPANHKYDLKRARELSGLDLSIMQPFTKYTLVEQEGAIAAVRQFWTALDVAGARRILGRAITSYNAQRKRCDENFKKYGYSRKREMRERGEEDVGKEQVGGS